MSPSRGCLLLAAFLIVAGGLLEGRQGEAAPDKQVVGAQPSPDSIPRLIKQLGSNKYAEREAASKALENIGEPALDALRESAAAEDPEVRHRAARLVLRIEGRMPEARTFAQEILNITDVIHDDYVVELNQGDLAAWAVRGLYRKANKEIPLLIEKRLASAGTLKGIQLGTLLRDARALVGRSQDLADHKDIDLAVEELLAHLEGPSDYFVPERFHRGGRGGWTPPGIGVRLSKDASTDLARVVTPVLNSPAYKAGIRAGDLITDVILRHARSGRPLEEPQVTSTRDLSLGEVERSLMGRPGTKVYLNIQPEGAPKSHEVEITRDWVASETVLGTRRMEDDRWDYLIDPEYRIGYARLTKFDEETAHDLHAVVGKLDKQAIKGFILDLRSNPGGFLSTAIPVADLFIDKERIVTIRTRGGQDVDYNGDHEGSYLNFPVVCLLDGQSAACSEIVAGCLQDHKRAVVMGERSLGQGGVQNIQTVGMRRLKLTTGLYFRPSGKKIDRMHFPGRPDDEWGVTPDKGYELSLTAAEREQWLESLRQLEIIPHHDQQAEKKKAVAEDRQLALALDYLRRQMHGKSQAGK